MRFRVQAFFLFHRVSCLRFESRRLFFSAGRLLLLLRSIIAPRREEKGVTRFSLHEDSEEEKKRNTKNYKRVSFVRSLFFGWRECSFSPFEKENVAVCVFVILLFLLSKNSRSNRFRSTNILLSSFFFVSKTTTKADSETLYGGLTVPSGKPLVFSLFFVFPSFFFRLCRDERKNNNRFTTWRDVLREPFYSSFFSSTEGRERETPRVSHCPISCDRKN